MMVAAEEGVWVGGRCGRINISHGGGVIRVVGAGGGSSEVVEGDPPTEGGGWGRGTTLGPTNRVGIDIVNGRDFVLATG